MRVIFHCFSVPELVKFFEDGQVWIGLGGDQREKFFHADVVEWRHSPSAAIITIDGVPRTDTPAASLTESFENVNTRRGHMRLLNEMHSCSQRRDAGP